MLFDGVDDWAEIFSAADIKLPGRWKVFWNYVIRGKHLTYKLSAFVRHDGSRIAMVKLFQQWNDKE
jgi:hypothetical protein